MKRIPNELQQKAADRLASSLPFIKKWLSIPAPISKGLRLLMFNDDALDLFIDYKHDSLAEMVEIHLKLIRLRSDQYYSWGAMDQFGNVIIGDQWWSLDGRPVA